MKSKTFIILLVICGLLAGAAYVVLNPGKSEDKNNTDSELLSELPVNDIASMTVKGPENEVILEKGEKVWEVKNKFGYPADFGKISEFAKKLKDMKIGRSFKASDDTRTRLDLYAPDQKDSPQESRGTRITLKDKGGKVLADIIIGKPREVSSGYGGHYIMPVNGKSIYVVDKDFKYMDKKTEDWLNKDIVNIASADVAQLVCKDSDDNVLYTLNRSEKGKSPEFVNPPEGKKVITSKLNDVIGALASLKLEDIGSPASSGAQTGLDKAVSFEYRLFDGTTYTAMLGNTLKDDNDKYFFKIKAGFTAAEKKAEEVKDDAAESSDSRHEDAAAKDKKEEEKDPAQLAAEAEELNKKISAWTFVIPKWKASKLISSADDFFEKPKQEESAEASE